MLHDHPGPSLEAFEDHEAERKRLAVLASLRIMDTDPEHAFDSVAEIARKTLGTKIALISLVDDRRQWFKATCGITASETPREQAFCAHAIRGDGLFVVEDARRDPRFAENPLVTGAPHIRFYAGAPIWADGGLEGEGAYPLGTLCVIDDAPRALSEDESRTLRGLADIVEALLHARTAAMMATDLAEEQRLTMLRLDRAHRQFRQAERMANIGSWRVTLADNQTEWSDQVYAIHRLPIGSRHDVPDALDYFPPHARNEVSAALERTIAGGQPFDLETDFVTAMGDLRRVRTMGELETRDGQPIAIIGVFQDVTARHALEQALRRTAMIDDLTGLANRAGLNEALDAAILEARRSRSPLAVLLLDLDNFKTVNDRCGHLAGDDLLRLTGSRLSGAALDGCFAGRLGGDEFVVVVPGRDDAALAALMRRLLLDLQHEVGCDTGEIATSATIGASWLDDIVPGRSELLHRADLALYAAKRTRRGSGMIFGGPQIFAVDPAAERGKGRG